LPQFDLPLAELRAYTPQLPCPEDFAAFWAKTLEETRAYPLAATFTQHDSCLTVLETYDVTFAGFGGNPIKAWLHLPAHRTGPLPAVVEYVGYGGGRGLAHERNMWAQAGYAHLVMDIRGQGSSWSVGDTFDPESVGSPAHPGVMTQGILDPHTYYYRRLFADAVRAVEAVRTHEAVDPTRVAVAGGSQGGAISLAVAGLVDDLMASLPDVPFLCDFPRSTTIVDSDPYGEIVRYLKNHRNQVERVFNTLSYFDCATLCRTANAPTLFSVGLMDQTCPPSTVFAAFNRYASTPAGAAPGSVAKQILDYPFNQHEGGQGFHDIEKMRWLRQLVQSARSGCAAD
jgi:cephalosporin-C deacetylase